MATNWSLHILGVFFTKPLLQKYFLVVNLVQKKPVDVLLSELRRGKYISKDRVIRESKFRRDIWNIILTISVQTKASDPDIVATSSVMSLKDPVQMTRIQTPCRSMACKHNECFDAAAYLYLQEQAPTWTCPCCNRSAPWDTLVFDQYFDDILQKVASNVDQVTVEPDGRWHIDDAKPSSSNGNHGHDSDDDDDDDDDLIEISAPRSSTNTEFVRTPSVVNTPDLAFPSPSISQSSNKRKHAETIDLTGDDSDDDQPVRPPPKRSDTNSSFNFNPTQYQSPQYPAPIRFHMPPPASSSNTYHTNGYYN